MFSNTQLHFITTNRNPTRQMIKKKKINKYEVVEYRRHVNLYVKVLRHVFTNMSIKIFDEFIGKFLEKPLTY